MKGIRAKLIPFILLAFIVQGVMQVRVIFPKWQEDYAPKQMAFDSDLSPDQLLFVLAGFREMIAGILWVQADKFFETGNYDAILPIIRLVTLLDPHQIDVYATGMWHIGYNFTDEEHRSDRRYIPSALALGFEGTDNNPETYELFFETGWMWYHKIDDKYENAVTWWEQAIEREDMLAARRNLLPKAYLRKGDIDSALGYYFTLLEDAEAKAEEEGGFANRQNVATVENNLDNLLVRMSQRGYYAQQRGDWTPQSDPNQAFAYDTQDPFDVGFSVRVTVEEPMILRVQGTWRVSPVGTRVRFVLRDKEYENAIPGGLDWAVLAAEGLELDPPRDKTFLQDQLFVRNMRFDKQIDMSRDPTMYPFEQDEYVLDFYYSPQSAPAHIQDKFGFRGEGFTDSNFLSTDARTGERVMHTTLELTREQILREGEWAINGGRTPVVETMNYEPPPAEALRGDLIQVPNLLAE